MSSESYKKFQNNIIDVDRLIESHGKLRSGNQGKQGLGHITRSGVVMLCASWELYLEELCKEAAIKLVEKINLPQNLPKLAQKELSTYVKTSKNDLKVLDLAGEGWKNVYLFHVEELTKTFNTPKVEQGNNLFKKTLGLEYLFHGLGVSENEIDHFVIIRGDIAHSGRQANYVKIQILSNYKDQIERVVVDIDNKTSDFIKDNTDNRKPWNSTPQIV